MVDDRQNSARQALSDLLVDERLLSGNAGECKTEVGKRTLELGFKFEQHPLSVTDADIERVVNSQYSQIPDKRRYIAHVTNTAAILRDIARILANTYPNIDLPTPGKAYATGLVHDLSAAVSDYAKGGHQSKELDLFFMAEALQWPTIAEHVSMHSDYLGIARLLSKGTRLPNPEYEPHYRNMKEVLLSGKSQLSYQSIGSRFRGFIEGRENLPLLILTVADYIENGRPSFEQGSLERDFDERFADIMWRYHTKPVQEGRPPSLIGQALVEGGMERIKYYKRIVQMLLANNPDEIEKLRQSTNFFKS